MNRALSMFALGIVACILAFTLSPVRQSQAAYNPNSDVVTVSGMQVIQTNFNLGQVYANNFGVPIQVSATFTMNTALIAGKSQIQLRVGTLVTNTCTVPTVLLGIGLPYQNGLSGFVPIGSSYSFVDASTGSGNSVNGIVGQIFVP